MGRAHSLGEKADLLEVTIGRHFQYIAERYPDHVAIIMPHQNIRWTYRELNTEVDRLGRTPMPALLPSSLPHSATLNMRQADWNERLVEHIERTVKSGLGSIELSLRPKNLGEIQVLIRIQNEETTVQIITETAAAARMLHGGEDRLAQVLDQSGYRLSGFLAQEHGLGAKGGQQGQQGQSSPRRNKPFAEAAQREEASEVATKSIYHTGRNNGSGINMLA